ncbi:MAG: RNA-binding S4 domain-containing protein [Tenuifilaceae bacterium]
MEKEGNYRVDKWLWSVRIFKTRTIAAEYCKKGRVLMNDNPVKPSKELRVGDIVLVRKPPITYSFRVKGVPKNRLGAKLVSDYIENITPREELQKIDPSFMAFYGTRERGTGRPTKRDRRTIDTILDSTSDSFDWDDDPQD